MLFQSVQASHRVLICFLLLSYVHIASTSYAADIPTQLAKVYSNESIQKYLVSEKYDGVRAIWKNGKLYTRNGNIIHAPAWFTEVLPDVWLDGELWYKRNGFEYVMSTVSKHQPIDAEWQRITYMVFDAPNYKQDFQTRSQHYTSLLKTLNLAHVKPVEQFSVQSQQALQRLLKAFTEKGAEGLMLQKATAMFDDGRSSNLLKLKTYMDAEAVVIKHMEGKGKYRGHMGALLVQYTNAKGQQIRFKIGTGFSDAERKKPPPIGATVTFQYHGYTKRGVPKFASFLRVYNDDNVLNN
jgi:DNA ligase-1